MRSLRSIARFLTVTLALASALPAAAQQPVQLTSVGARVVVNGYYVGHYTISTPGQPSLDVYCVDFLNGVSVGNTWNAHFSNVSGSLANTRRGEVARNLYLRAAWLTTQFAHNATSEWGAIHAAIWYTMAPANQRPSVLAQSNWWRWEVGQTDVADWLALANANYQSVNPNWHVLVTDVNAVGRVTGGRQEYMTTVTPEPITMVLLGSGLVGTLGAARLKRRREDEIEGLTTESDSEGV